MKKKLLNEILKSQEKILQKIEESRNYEQPVKLYSLGEVAQVFSVTIRTIYNWKEQGILPCTIIGSKSFLTSAQLEAFVSEHEVKPVKYGRILK